MCFRVAIYNLLQYSFIGSAYIQFNTNFCNLYAVTELEQYIGNLFETEATTLSSLAAFFRPRSIKKGDYLLKTGRICDLLCFVQSGLVRIYVQQPDKEITQWISSKGYFVTDLASFLFQAPARWNIQALTDCELYCIDHKTYNQLGETIPDWHRLEKLFISKCFIILENRVFSHLSMSAEERYYTLSQQQPELFNQVPLQYLASMLGMTPETLSRLRRKAMN